MDTSEPIEIGTLNYKNKLLYLISIKHNCKFFFFKINKILMLYQYLFYEFTAPVEPTKSEPQSEPDTVTQIAEVTQVTTEGTFG